MEPIDAWPALPGVHYLEFPSLERESASSDVDGILDGTDLEDVARRAHEDLALYSPQYCVERFLVPASAELLA